MTNVFPLHPLGEICDVLDKLRRPITKKDRVVGEYPYYGATGVLDFVEGYIFDEKLILIGEDGAKWGAGESTAFAAEGKYWVNNHAHVIRPHRSTVLDQWIIYYLNAIDLSTFITGLTVPKLNQAKLREIPIPRPPLPEQKRIVAILDEAFAGIDAAVANTEKNLANARELFESTAQAIFRERTDWDKLSLAELLDRGWITSHLDGNHGGDYPRKAEFIDSGVPYISANCIKNESVDISLAKYLSPERAATLRKGIAQDRDVLFAHNATVGPVAMLYTDLNKAILSTSLTYYRCNFEHINPEYLAHYMRSPEFKNQYKMVMRQSTRNQVPITKQREFTHIIPPLSEQTEIATKLDGLSSETNRLETIFQRKLDALAELRQSLLHKAFAGELSALPEKDLDEAVA